MGIWDRFKRKKDAKMIEKPESEQMSSATFSKTDEGKFCVDFFDEKGRFGDFYDTTRLIVSEEPIVLEGQHLSECLVSWYGQNDAVMMKNGKELMPSRKNNYKEVLAKIDLELLQSDPRYCEWVMKGLLNQRRVEEYLARGLTENPEVPCGKYVGAICRTVNGYSKFFNSKVGEAAHNSKEMQEARRKREEEKTQRDAEGNYHRREIDSIEGNNRE